MYIAVACIILGHGLLHWILSNTFNCYTDVEKETEELGYTLLFFIFSFFLSSVILGFGFGKLYKCIILGVSVIFAVAVTQVAKSTGGSGGGELALPSLFVFVHPLSCVTGLLSRNPSFSSTVAIWFVVCTIIGIIELAKCDNILRPIGGHFWYDVTLHVAVLAALPYFNPPLPEENMNEEERRLL